LPTRFLRLLGQIPKAPDRSPETIGDHVRRRRQELGLTQTEAAKAVGVVRDALARWESKGSDPDLRTLPAVIKFLGYDPRPSPSTFAEFLKHARGGMGLSVPELAAQIGIPAPSLHAWEQGRYEPSQKRVLAVKARISDNVGKSPIPS
jgi:transcriptional regulator with XRE-family HTH domain